jgi:hypothetical protein
MVDLLQLNSIRALRSLMLPPQLLLLRAFIAVPAGVCVWQRACCAGPHRAAV